jgi:hypothetical protein
VPQATNLESPRFHEHIENLIISLGGHGFSMVMSPQDPTAEPVSINGYVPIRLRLIGDRIGVDMSLWNGSELPPVEVHGTEFVVRPPSWDQNSNANALEIVDGNQHPVFQLVYLSASHVRVEGIFPIPPAPMMTLFSKGGVLLAGDAGAWPVEAGKPWPHDFKITPIFKYPAWKYPGIYAAP